MNKIITDYGYCYGVENALTLLKEASHQYSSIYLTHPLIHNIPENNQLMNEAHASLLENNKISSNSAIVLSAHGHSLSDEERFKNKATIIDATCPLILKRYEKAFNRNDESISYFYLGKKNHQETIGFLSHFPHFIFLDSALDIIEQMKNISIKEKAIFIPQTTVSKKTWSIVNEYLKLHSQLILSLPICPLYEKRSSQAILATKDLDTETNYFIVCGDKSSSNAKEIYQAIKENNPLLEGVIALSINEIDLNFIKNKNIFIASATSVNKLTVEKLKTDLDDLDI